MTQHPPKQAIQHMIRLKFFSIAAWAESFLHNCQSRDLSPHSITYYKAGLLSFAKFCAAQDVNEIEMIAPDALHAYMLELEATGHNPGGRHAKYRAVPAFLLWYEREAEPEQWRNPIAKVKPPKTPIVYRVNK
jgi:site-specific recombinase XerD